MNQNLPADADPNDLYSGLEPEEWDELYDIQTQFMLFKGIVDGKSTWKQVIAALRERAQSINELKEKGARILDNCEGMLLYHVPSHYGAYATFVQREERNYHFKLHTKQIVRVPIAPHYDLLKDTPIGSRIVVLLDSDCNVLNFRVSEVKGSLRAKIKIKGAKDD